MATSGVSLPSGGAPVSGASGLDGLDGLLSSAFDSAVEQHADGGDPASTGVEGGDSSAVDLSQSTGEVDTQTDSASPAVDPNSPYSLSQDGNFYQVPKAELPQFQAAKQYFDQVSQVFQTPQEASSAAAQASDLRIMSNDWLSGNDQSIIGVLSHFAGANQQNPAIRQRFEQSFAKSAQHIPDLLKRIAPQAFEGLQSRLISDKVDAAYQKALTSGNPEDFKEAQYLDFGLTGQYKTDPSQVTARQQAQPGRQQPNANDPATQRLEATYQRDLRSDFVGQTETAKFDALKGNIDKLLKPLDGRRTEKELTAIKGQIRKDVVDAIQQHRQDFWTEHQQEFYNLRDEYRASWMRGDPKPGAHLAARIAAYNQSFLSQANRLLPSIAKEYLTPGAKTTQNGTATRQPNGQFAANQPQPRPQAQPQPSPKSGPYNPPGRVSSDEFDRQFAAAFK